jgi:preprotein translocase subunit SecG
MPQVFYFITMGLFLFVCLVMILLVLIQKGRGGGLSSAFGGSGGNTAFGAKTGDVLTWATSVVFAIFIILAVVLNLLANRIGQAPASSFAHTSMPMSSTPSTPASPMPTPSPAPAPGK